MAESRAVEFTFNIPFDGHPAEICEAEIRKQITHSLLNSLSEIHPDIRCEITGFEQKDGTYRHWRQWWDDIGRRWTDLWSDGAVRESGRDAA